MKIKILIPVYNDWQSTFKLIDEINGLSIDPKFQISIIIVNDASNHDRPNFEKNLENIKSEFEPSTFTNIFLAFFLIIH